MKLPLTEMRKIEREMSLRGNGMSSVLITDTSFRCLLSIMRCPVDSWVLESVIQEKGWIQNIHFRNI